MAGVARDRIELVVGHGAICPFLALEFEGNVDTVGERARYACLCDLIGRDEWGIGLRT